MSEPVENILTMLETGSPDGDSVVEARKQCIVNHVRFPEEKDPDVAPLTHAAVAVLRCILTRRFGSDWVDEFAPDQGNGDQPGDEIIKDALKEEHVVLRRSLPVGELVETLTEYMKLGSTDGKPERHALRVRLKELVDIINNITDQEPLDGPGPSGAQGPSHE